METEAGKAMMLDLAELYLCESTEKDIKRAVYKATDCGAFVVFPSDSPLRVGVGSIVEGSDTEIGPLYVNYSDQDGVFIEAWRNAVQEVERQADSLWREANN